MVLCRYLENYAKLSLTPSYLQPLTSAYGSPYHNESFIISHFQ